MRPYITRISLPEYVNPDPKLGQNYVPATVSNDTQLEITKLSFFGSDIVYLLKASDLSVGKRSRAFGKWQGAGKWWWVHDDVVQTKEMEMLLQQINENSKDT